MLVCTTSELLGFLQTVCGGCQSTVWVFPFLWRSFDMLNDYKGYKQNILWDTLHAIVSGPEAHICIRKWHRWAVADRYCWSATLGHACDETAWQLATEQRAYLWKQTMSSPISLIQLSLIYFFGIFKKLYIELGGGFKSVGAPEVASCYDVTNTASRGINTVCIAYKLQRWCTLNHSR